MLRLRHASRRLISSLSSLRSRRSIILAGAAGCGKTTVGKILAQRLGRLWIDVDYHILEPTWHQSVAEKLAKLGDTAFLAAESEAVRQFQIPEASVISLSGSNPLDLETMAHVSKYGVVIYLDYPIETIQTRLEQMKVNRIVGRSGGLSIGSILRGRAAFYNSCYDIRVVLTSRDSPEEIADLVLHAFGKNEQFVSCRGYQGSETFAQVLQKGLAPDKGLFVPQNLLAPWTIDQLGRLTSLDFRSRLLRVMEHFPLGDLHPSKLAAMISQSYQDFQHPDNILPLCPLHNNLFLQETFHGPTASFKDLALQLTPKLISWATTTERFQFKLALLVATSGDTGVAALDGFSKVHIPSIVLYPSHGVSTVQKHQMLVIAETNPRTCVIGVDGDFDFCQNAVKHLLSSNSIVHSFKLTSGNSMNWGRFVPQVAYAVHSYSDLVQNGHLTLGNPMDVVVPSGNFGHILGMYLAKKLFGVPIRRLICASNENDVLVKFLTTGVYDLRHRHLQRTFSPSVDILVSSNVERLLYFLSDGDVDFVTRCYDLLIRDGYFTVTDHVLTKIRKDFRAMACSERECLETITTTYAETKTVLDPHTALAVFVGKRMRVDDVPIVVSATAHYGKFPFAVLKALGMCATPEDSLPAIASQLCAIPTHSKMHQGLSKIMETPISKHQERHLPADMALIHARVFEFLGEQSLQEAR